MEPKSFDLVVIGGGPAGSSGAVAATLFGKRVALVEKEIKVGGAGLNPGTIPSKALRESALILSGWRARKLLGVDVALRQESTAPELAYHADRVREALRSQVRSRLGERGVEVFQGSASFADSYTLRVVDPAGRETWLKGKTKIRPVRAPGLQRRHKSLRIIWRLEAFSKPQPYAAFSTNIQFFHTFPPREGIFAGVIRAVRWEPQRNKNMT